VASTIVRAENGLENIKAHLLRTGGGGVQMMDSLVGVTALPRAREPRDNLPTPELIGEYAGLLVSGETSLFRSNVDSFLNESGITVLGLWRDLIQPAMYRIGDLWEAGKVTVAQEHLASVIVADLLARQAGSVDGVAGTSDRSALFSCVQGSHRYHV
jgi:methanogenic corrinoid protein MtbC1